ncbi:hypothetical protein B484DRAFT_49400 [Ochromonadaceae sp. CCMP2298]|nr:hypothetical protein B484DRAFT_49400 [Ochromonadaceae sp. CCMP2298]
MGVTGTDTGGFTGLTGFAGDTAGMGCLADRGGIGGRGTGIGICTGGTAKLLPPVKLLLLCFLQLCLLYPAHSWVSDNYTQISVHSTTDAQALVSDCYPYLNSTFNANCTLRSAWSALSVLAPFQPVAILLPEAAELFMDAGLGGLELESSYNVTIEGQGATVRQGGANASSRFLSYAYSNSSNSTLPSLSLRNFTLSGFGTPTPDTEEGVVHLCGDMDLHVSAVTFNQNSASAIFAANITTGHLTVQGCSFLDSTAPRGAGAHLQHIHTAASAATPASMGALLFSYNRFDSLTAQHGAAMYIDSSTLLTVTHSTFSNCSASEGGAVYVNSSQHLSLTALRFQNCSATAHGGSLFLNAHNSDASLSNALFLRSSIVGGGSGGGGGMAVGHYNQRLSMNNVTFDQCTAGGSTGYAVTETGTGTGGGLLIISHNTNLTLVDVRFTGCEGFYGGGLCVDSYNEHALLEGLTFDKCRAVGAGGGLWLEAHNHHLTLSDSSFTQCSARWGGGLYVDTEHQHLLFTTLLVDQCSALLQGGGIYVNTRTSLTLTHSTLSNCSAGSRGGAAYLVKRNELRVSNCSLLGNTAADGGAVASYANSFALFSDTLFLSNVAVGTLGTDTGTGEGGDGGAAYLLANVDFSFLQCIFESNGAARNGGAIWVGSEGAGLNIAGSTFQV